VSVCVFVSLRGEACMCLCVCLCQQKVRNVCNCVCVFVSAKGEECM